MCRWPDRNQRFSTTMFFQEILFVVRSGNPSARWISQLMLNVEIVSDPGAVLLPRARIEHLPETYRDKPSWNGGIIGQIEGQR